MDEADLITIVRGLDQHGPGDDGQNLRRLWTQLAANSNLRFHAAEGVTLRWLLKSMHGPSDAAETLRRYPLTWTILECVFQRIPLFSLAKSLADRRFIVVLQSTLKDLAQPSTSVQSPPSSKRKRSPSIDFSKDVLQSPRNCLETALVVFSSIRSLLARLDSCEKGSSRDNIGAEHIKSVFCTSGSDAVLLVAPALRICQNLLSDCSEFQKTGCEDWIKTISQVWDLHLQGSEDVSEIGSHVFPPASLIFAKLGAFSSCLKVEVPDGLRDTWLLDLQHFMFRNFVLPARAEFIKSQDVFTFTAALAHCENTLHLAAPALYTIASAAFRDLINDGPRKDNAWWIKSTFKLIEQAIKKRADRNTLMESILERALETAAPVAVDVLQAVLREYCLQEGTVDWSLTATISQCQPDVFHLAEEGSALRKEICERIIDERNIADHRSAILRVIVALQDGFRVRRDLSGFLSLWLEQMCSIEKDAQQKDCPWFTFVSHALNDEKSIASILETEMSPKQLEDVILIAREAASGHRTDAIAVFTSTMVQGIKSESFIDAVGRQLFDVVIGLRGSSSFSALRWRVVSATLSWVIPNDRADIWSAVKKTLAKIVDNAPILSAETYEAFKCCCRAWEMFSPDDPCAKEPAEMVEAFIERLSSEIAAANVPVDENSFSVMDLSIEAEFHEECGHQQYISWMLNASSRFQRMCFASFGKLLPALYGTIESGRPSTQSVTLLEEQLLRNDININEAKLARCLVYRLVTAVADSEQDGHWLGQRGRSCITALLRIPLDLIDRSQRESVMTVLIRKQLSMLKAREGGDIDDCRLVLSLCTRLMQRPTFYEKMCFGDLITSSEVVSNAIQHAQSRNEVSLELLERFSRFTSVVLRQMSDHMDDRSIKYFREAASFVAGCDGGLVSATTEAIDVPPLHLTLLKSLAQELNRSNKVRAHDESTSLLQKTQQVISTCAIKPITSYLSKNEARECSGPATDLSLFSAIDAIPFGSSLPSDSDLEEPSIRKLEERTWMALSEGDLMAWKVQIFLRRQFSRTVKAPPPIKFAEVDKLPGTLQETLLADLVSAITSTMDAATKYLYLQDLIGVVKEGWQTNGQMLAIDTVVSDLLDSSDFLLQSPDGFTLSTAHSDLTLLLITQPHHTAIIGRVLQNLLEKRSQCMKQWNIEATLSTVVVLASSRKASSSFSSLCKLVEVVIKKHRLRLESHFHLVLPTMQALLDNLITVQHPAQEAHAHLYTRLVTLICEPTAGSVSRGQLHGALDSATDAAKRSAGRHMYLILAHYVKLQLEVNVASAVSEALEPATNSIFNITPPETRKILNDVMDASGRAILREMYKRYVQFGKWSGV